MPIRTALAALALALLILVSWGGGYQDAQARSIPWDCSDWQAFAHDDRPTAILESLAENRGKTLYCGIDQSDTFAKEETWAAGKDRNERDDTVYFGERGSFRGFIAAQEGWLTEGESGITGVSIDRIFEFPREERRVKRVKRFDVGSGPASPNNCPDPDASENSQPGALICTDFGPYHSSYTGNASVSLGAARATYADESTATNWEIHWRTRVRSVRTNNGQTVTASGTAGARFLTAAQWTAKAEAAAVNACRARGARYVDGSADFGPGHSDDAGEGDRYHGANLGWFYAVEEHSTSPGQFRRKARESRTWTATCKKTVRRTRR